MTTQNKNAETVKDSGKLENIKQLNILNQPGSEVVSLFNNVKAARKKLDSILAEAKERGQNAIQQRLDEERRISEEAASKNKLEKYPAEKTEAVFESKTEPDNNIFIEKTNAAESAEAPKTEIINEPVINPAETKPVSDNIRTRQFDNTPSYIKGTYTPAPPVQRQPRQDNRNNNTQGTSPRPPYNNNAARTQSGGGQFQRPQYNNNAPRPGQGGGQFQRPPYNSPRPNQGGGQFQRPMGSSPSPLGAKKPVGKVDLPIAAGKERKAFDNKKKEYSKPGDDKKSMNKRTLIRKGFIQENVDEDRAGVRKLKNKKNKVQPLFVPQKIESAVITTENLTVKILSEKIGKTAQEIIKQLMLLGIMTTINSVVDFPTMELVANELGVELTLKVEQTKEELLEKGHDEEDEEINLTKRPPIITVMGHVDHGKTSLLDAIRKTNVATGEAGGITQHIGAYSVNVNGEKITFLDTPGHEAFTAMRARGTKVTDIAVLVVAADDGIMPTTVEAINHAKAANIPIIVAINKIDKPAANIDKIKQALTEYNLVTEEWGGDTIVVPLSAKTGQGIDKLLESILLVAEVNNYRANPNRAARGSVIEAKLDKGKGPIANIIVQNGTLRVGDILVSGVTSGRVRAMIDDKGKQIKLAGPSTAISILGFTDVPNAGDTVFSVEDDKMAKQVVAERTAKIRNDQTLQTQKVSVDEMFNKISEDQIKDLNIVLKADVQGSVEALKSSLSGISNAEAKVNIVHGGVGAINKSDLMLAEVSKAIIIGFNVRPDAETKSLAETAGVDIRLYNIIYEAIDDIELAIKGLLTVKYKENITGRAQVRNIFKITGTGMVAGSYVTNGKIHRNSKARVFRNGEVVFEGTITGLKRFKEDVKDVAEGYECGISLDKFSDLKENDEIEAYLLEEIKN